ncbi:hypothetical protein Scep_009627 [Stephania cephalantha]|uniref:Uncharacterized protein n=1 Tax=Stephania cephalantha TaxID=152367 RepID=A0AAP0PGF7_9MAGN
MILRLILTTMLQFWLADHSGAHMSYVDGEDEESDNFEFSSDDGNGDNKP